MRVRRRGGAKTNAVDATTVMPAEWVAWINEIETQVLTLVTDRRIFRESLELLRVQEHSDKRNPWIELYQRMYSDSVAMAVRRLADETESRSLYRFLGLLVNDAAVLVRVGPRPTQWSRPNGLLAWFFEARDSADPVQMVRRVISQDRQRLQTLSKSIYVWASKVVAHLTQEKPKAPSFLELYELIDTLVGLWRRYAALIRDEHYGLEEPIIVFGWKHIFAEPVRPPAEPRGIGVLDSHGQPVRAGRW